MPPRPLKPQLIFAALSARLEAAPLQKRGGPSFQQPAGFVPGGCEHFNPEYFNPL
jgi:hypothetical protein